MSEVVIDVKDFVYNNKKGNEAFTEYFNISVKAVEEGRMKTACGDLKNVIYIIDNPYAFEGRLLVDASNHENVYACMFYELTPTELELHFMFTLYGGSNKSAFEKLFKWASENVGLFKSRELTFRAEKEYDQGRNVRIMTDAMRGFVKSAATVVKVTSGFSRDNQTASYAPSSNSVDYGEYLIETLDSFGRMKLCRVWQDSYELIRNGKMTTACENLHMISEMIMDHANSGFVMIDQRQQTRGRPLGFVLYEWTDNGSQFNCKLMFTLNGGENFEMFKKLWNHIYKVFGSVKGNPPKVVPNNVMKDKMAGFVESGKKSYLQTKNAI